MAFDARHGFPFTNDVFRIRHPETTRDVITDEGTKSVWDALKFYHRYYKTRGRLIAEHHYNSRSSELMEHAMQEVKARCHTDRLVEMEAWATECRNHYEENAPPGVFEEEASASVPNTPQAQ